MVPGMGNGSVKYVKSVGSVEVRLGHIPGQDLSTPKNNNIIMKNV
jgi:hypothetical protein